MTNIYFKLEEKKPENSQSSLHGPEKWSIIY